MKDDVIGMAKEAGSTRYTSRHYPDRPTHTFTVEQLERFVEFARAGESKRADALAATIAALRDIVTSEAESKAEFIARVREVLGACPDQRVLHAVEAEREACARICDTTPPQPFRPSIEAAHAIRARGQA